MIFHDLPFPESHWYPETAGANMSLFLTVNPDNSYPLSEVDKPKIPGLAIVCSALSGMRGEGTDISNITIKLLKEKLSALFIDLHRSYQDVTATSSELLIQSIEAIFDQVNQDIVLQNQTQGTDRYGVSVVLALYFARPNVSFSESPDRQIEYEIYLAHVGDCRAYWITSKSCHQLTLDDIYANLEISSERSTHQEMLTHPSVNIPTQLLGSSIDRFNLNLKRLILQESGVLMLCSRRLSVNNLVEESWQTSMHDFFQGHVSLQDLAQSWLTLANEKNGQEHSSIALMELLP
jgi:protein phosphatase